MVGVFLVSLAAPASLTLQACERLQVTTLQPDGTPSEPGLRKVTLNGSPGEPMGLAVLPDLRVLHTTRRGTVWLHSPATGANTVAAQIDVYAHDEEGLQGIAIDPHFDENGWVYIYYSPPLDTPAGDAPLSGAPADWQPFEGYLQLSRFRFEADALDLGSEQQLLRVPVDRGVCCHVGGDIDFDADGNLILTTGDDTNPFRSDGFTPIDERASSHPALDAQRSAANTNDLRGKLLRIRVLEDGRYEIPEGNLFEPGVTDARPEIYAMGLRNPFRIAADHRRGRIYVADYSPDARQASPARGPVGYGRWLSVAEPGNYGWPYCLLPDLPYRDYDFESMGSGVEFACEALENPSPRNTGRRLLPAMAAVDLYYGYARSGLFPELGQGGVAPMAGPVYDYDEQLDSDVKWPASYDGAALFYEWVRDRVQVLRLTERGELDVVEPALADVVVDNPIDMEFGPDGALYVLEYGDNYYQENPDAQLSRFEFAR